MCDDKKVHGHNKFLNSPMDRRALLKTLGSFGVSMAVLGCAESTSNKIVASTDSTTDSSTTGGGTQCVVSASETNGPFPADGSNSAGDGNSAILDQVYSGSPIIRTNITSNYDGTQVMPGIPLNLTITLQNTNNSCAVLTGYYIYIWHCSAAGQYSAYTGSGNGGTHSRTETYLRGIQQTNSSGQVTFSTIYPGWYTGRTVHIHAEVYSSLSATSPIRTTQFAFPEAINNAVMATSGYPGTSGLMTNSADGIFSDGTSTEMLAITGSTGTGYYATMTVRVAA